MKKESVNVVEFIPVVFKIGKNQDHIILLKMFNNLIKKGFITIIFSK